MRIRLIQPSHLDGAGRAWRFQRLFMPSLSPLTVAGLPPPWADVRLTLDAVEEIDFDEQGRAAPRGAGGARPGPYLPPSPPSLTPPSRQLTSGHFPGAPGPAQRSSSQVGQQFRVSPHDTPASAPQIWPATGAGRQT